MIYLLTIVLYFGAGEFRTTTEVPFETAAECTKALQGARSSSNLPEGMIKGATAACVPQRIT
jgi:hypothetical protein